MVGPSDSGGYMEIISLNHNLKEGDVIRFTTTDTLPTGLALATDYYVVGTPSTCLQCDSVNTFFVSQETGSGAPIVVWQGDEGTGDHSWQLVPLPATRYVDILDDLDDTLRDIENKRRVIIEINYE